MAATFSHRHRLSGGWLKVTVLSLVATIGLAFCMSIVLESPVLTSPFFSEVTWRMLVATLGGAVDFSPTGESFARVPLAAVMAIAAALVALAWLIGAALKTWITECRWSTALLTWGQTAGLWWLLPGLWSGLWLTASIANWPPVLSVLTSLLDLLAAIVVGGLLASLFSKRSAKGESAGRHWRWILASGIVLYIAVFTAMNWGLWFNLHIPHGDSAMYEEHLWNLTHGKGFRSYLDQGLFLGEHIQVVHVLFLPVYLLWPSHLLLELLESAALASAAIPVFLIASRHSQSERTAALLGLAYLLYFPMQYLDIAIDLKTFRPIAFGVPLLLWTIDSMERRAWKTMALFAALTLTCKEDYAIPLAMLGLWQSIVPTFSASDARQRKQTLIAGLTLFLVSTVYLYVAVKWAIPWFRGGEAVHYVRYFPKFGTTPTEVLWNMVSQPRLLASQLFTLGALTYGLHLLVPIAGLPLRSPTRLLTALPLFALLCLNELAQEVPSPVHHFHAPIIPLLFWAAAAGLAGGQKAESRGQKANGPGLDWLHVEPALAAVCFAFSAGLIFGMSPLSLQFWDAGRSKYWQALYIPDERARQFEKVLRLIPRSARVASTDFVHPRFTHYERSYDYSKYPRKVANYQDRVPDDTEYIIIDTRHPYSEIHSPGEMREIQREPRKWDVLPDDTNGYYIVLKRRPLGVQ